MSIDRPKPKKIEREPFVSGLPGVEGEFQQSKSIPEIVENAKKQRRINDMKKRFPEVAPTPEQIQATKRMLGERDD